MKFFSIKHEKNPMILCWYKNVGYIWFVVIWPNSRPINLLVSLQNSQIQLAEPIWHNLNTSGNMMRMTENVGTVLSTRSRRALLQVSYVSMQNEILVHKVYQSTFSQAVDMSCSLEKLCFSPASQAASRAAGLPQARCLPCEHLRTDHADCNQCKEQHSSLQRSSWDADKHWIQPSSPDLLINLKYQKEYCLKPFCHLITAPQSSRVPS